MSESVVVFLNYVVYGCFAVTLIALPFMVVNVTRAANKGVRLQTLTQRWTDIPIKSVLFFIVPIAVGMSLTAVICAHARSKAFVFLESLPSPHAVLVDGHAVTDEKNLIAALKTAGSVMGHHSHPSKTIHVVIAAGGQVLRLNLSRDSQDPQEYWVFYPEYRVSSMNEIGRISTSALDGY